MGNYVCVKKGPDSTKLCLIKGPNQNFPGEHAPGSPPNNPYNLILPPLAKENPVHGCISPSLNIIIHQYIMYPLCVFCNHAVSWLPLKTKQQYSSFYFQFYFQLKFVPQPRKCGYSGNTQLYSLTSVWRSTVCLSLCPKFVRGAVKVPYFHTVTQYLSLLVRFTLVWGSTCKNTSLSW